MDFDEMLRVDRTSGHLRTD